MRYRLRLWGSDIDHLLAYIVATNEAEAVRVLREELRGLCDGIEVIGVTA